MRLFSYLADKEIRYTTAKDRFLLSVDGFAADDEREKASQRVTDAMQHRARSGLATCAVAFGWARHAVLGPGGKRSHVEIRIDESQAAIVRCIFAMSAAGAGMTTIARTLNREQAPTPTPKAGRSRGWS